MKHPRSAAVVIAFVLAALVLTVSGCELPGEAKEYRDPATLIEVEKGEEFAIVLESNPTTGYQWKLAEPLDEAIVVLVKTEFIEPDAELIGAAGEEKWTFKAQGLGNTSITMSYIRPWEEEEPAGTETVEGEGTEAGTEGTEAGAEGTEGTATETAEGEGSGEAEAISDQTTVTFNVRVKQAGSMDKEPKQYDNPDETIEVEAGLEFAIVLESNPTTGYSWQLAEPLDEDVVELVSSEFAKTSSESGTSEGEGEMVGVPGEEVWTFEAIAEGEAEIVLEYLRPWETDVAPESTETFKVTVTAAAEATAE